MNNTKSIEAQYNLDPETLEKIMSTDISEAITESTTPIIEPLNTFLSSYRTGTLYRHTKEQIIQALGFAPNQEDDPDKVENCWVFTVDGHECSIWDYRGSHKITRPYWSVYDPANVLGTVFGDENVEKMK